MVAVTFSAAAGASGSTGAAVTLIAVASSAASSLASTMAALSAATCSSTSVSAASSWMAASSSSTDGSSAGAPASASPGQAPQLRVVSGVVGRRRAAGLPLQAEAERRVDGAEPCGRDARARVEQRANILARLRRRARRQGSVEGSGDHSGGEGGRAPAAVGAGTLARHLVPHRTPEQAWRWTGRTSGRSSGDAPEVELSVDDPPRAPLPICTSADSAEQWCTPQRTHLWSDSCCVECALNTPHNSCRCRSTRPGGASVPPSGEQPPSRWRSSPPTPPPSPPAALGLRLRTPLSARRWSRSCAAILIQNRASCRERVGYLRSRGNRNLDPWRAPCAAVVEQHFFFPLMEGPSARGMATAPPNGALRPTPAPSCTPRPGSAGRRHHGDAAPPGPDARRPGEAEAER